MTESVESAARAAPDNTWPAITPGSRMVVMGGHGGIGACLAEALVVAGARVASLDLPHVIAARPLRPDITAVPIDATDATSIEAAFAAVDKLWGGLDGLVFATGFSPGVRPVAQTPLADWDAVLAVNLRAAFLAAKLAVPLMRDGGSIVMISSGLAVNVEPGWAPYAASKAGMIALAKVLAKEVAPAIRVNVVAPGAVDTPFLSGGADKTAEAGANRWFFESGLWDKLKPSIALGRIAVPQDVVGPVLFLLGPASGYMTGQTLHVNGGRFMP